MTNAMNIKTLKGKILMIAALLLASAALVSVAKPAEAAEYVPSSYDYLTTQTTHAGLATSQRGYVQWYLANRTWPLPDIYRGEYKNTYVTDRGTGVGCIYAKVTWHHATGSVSWPPSGTVSGSTTSDGFYRSCRASGQAHAYRINLSGVNYASSTLYATTLTICHSSFASTPKVCSSNKYYIA